MPVVRSLHRVPRGEIGYMAFGMFVEDNRTFALVLMIPPWERDLRVLRFEKAYMAAALAMPALVPWVHPDQSEAVTPVLPMGACRTSIARYRDGEPWLKDPAHRRCAMPHQSHFRLRRLSFDPARVRARQTCQRQWGLAWHCA